MYRKATHTNQYLAFESHHPIAHKVPQSGGGEDSDEPSRSLVILRCGTGTRREGGNWNTEGEWLPVQLLLQALLPQQTKARQRGAET